MYIINSQTPLEDRSAVNIGYFQDITLDTYGTVAEKKLRFPLENV